MLRIAHLLCRMITARTVVRRTLSDAAWRVEVTASNPSVNALVFIPETIDNGAEGLPLRDVPVAVKDNICTKDMPTTCSSRMLRDFTSPFDATVVQLLRKAGAPIVGKANCDEFGMGYVAWVYSVY